MFDKVKDVCAFFTGSSKEGEVATPKNVTFDNLGHNKVKITVSSKTQKNEITARVFAPEAVRQVQGFFEKSY